jgi:hypothetical protein
MTYKKQLSVVGIFILFLAACSQKEDSSSSVSTPPTATTESISTNPLGDFTGPLGGSVGEVIGNTEEDCSEGDSCTETLLNIDIARPLDALPLAEQTVGTVTVGVPEGYNPLELSSEILITAVSTETEGDYTFSIRQVDETKLEPLLRRFKEPDFTQGTSIEGEAFEGSWLLTEDYGAIALLQFQGGQQIFIEASSDRGYWPSFQATFEAMIASLSL